MNRRGFLGLSLGVPALGSAASLQPIPIVLRPNPYPFVPPPPVIDAVLDVVSYTVKSTNRVRVEAELASIPNLIAGTITSDGPYWIGRAQELKVNPSSR